jgi:ankyrin repeat protein
MGNKADKQSDAVEMQDKNTNYDESVFTKLDDELIDAADKTDLKLMKKAINAGATAYNTALLYAASSDNKEGAIEATKYLIPMAKDLISPLMEASKCGNADTMRLLMNAGANHYNAALYRAAIGGHVEAVELSIERGANCFDSALIEATKRKHYDVMKIILKTGKCNNCKPALLEAVKANDEVAIDMLMKDY